MAKHGNTFYLELKRDIFTEEYDSLSNNAKWLYVVLNELEQRYTGAKENFFFRTDVDLAFDCGMSDKTFKRAKAELKLKGQNLVKIWQGHYWNRETEKKSQKHMTFYKIL